MPTPGSANTPLIPRAKLFGNPTRAQGQIAPDGRWLSWLAPQDGVLNVWVAPIEAPDRARPITDDRKRGIRFYAWANTSRHLLFMQDEGGTEDWHIYAVSIDGGPARDLTPFAGVNARIEQLSLEHPHLLAVAINDRDKAWHDLYRIDINTAERELLFENQPTACWHHHRSAARATPRQQAARRRGRQNHLPHRRCEIAADAGRRARRRSHHPSTRLHPRRAHLLQHFVDRPRQGRVVCHHLGQRHDAAVGRASEGRHQPRDLPSAHRRGRGGRRQAPDARLDCAQ